MANIIPFIVHSLTCREVACNVSVTQTAMATGALTSVKGHPLSWTVQWVEARLIWTTGAVTPTETSNAEVRGYN